MDDWIGKELIVRYRKMNKKVVKEYKKHQLAEDSEDEKRIQKATARAERKLKVSATKRAASRPRPYFSREKTTPSVSAPVGNNAGGWNRPKPGACFKCGGRGHWSRTRVAGFPAGTNHG